MSELTTEHFELQYPAAIRHQTANKIARCLEGNYYRITGDMGGPALPRIQVYIHPDKESLKKITGFYAQGAIVGTGQIHLVKLGGLTRMLTSYEKLALHEFTHCVTLNLLISSDLSSGAVAGIEEWTSKYDPPEGPGFYYTYPRWLWESIACYEAKQISRATLLISVLNGFPSLATINSHGSKVYFMGYTVADFIVTRWGRSALNHLIKERGSLLKVLGISEDYFNKAYRDFIYRKYLGFYSRFFRLSSRFRSINLL